MKHRSIDSGLYPCICGDTPILRVRPIQMWNNTLNYVRYECRKCKSVSEMCWTAEKAAILWNLYGPQESYEPWPPLPIEPFAAFVVVRLEDGTIAASTRPHDELSPIGLPGGKVDWLETGPQAATREADEEGWMVIGLDPKPFHISVYKNKVIAWYAGKRAIKLDSYKEKDRGIEPIAASFEVVASLPYGNDEAMKAFLEYEQNA